MGDTSKPFYTYKQLYKDALCRSKGLTKWPSYTIELYNHLRPGRDRCYQCGRQVDHLYHYINLTTIYLPEYSPPLKNICQYCIGKASDLVDCQTGEVVKGTYINSYLLPLLDAWHWMALQLSYALRFVYYYIYYCVIVYLIDRYNLSWAIKLGKKLRIW